MRIIANEVDGTSSGKVYAFESRNIHLVQGMVGDQWGLFATESLAPDAPKILLKNFGSLNVLIEEMENIAVAEEDCQPVYDMTEFQNPAK